MRKLILFFIVSLHLLFADTRVYQEKVAVTRSEPMYKTITKTVPYEECYDEEYEQKIPIYSQDNQNNNSIGLDTLIGVTSGVVIGNQIGRGNGKVAAKIIGGLFGGAIANNMRNSNKTLSNGRDEYYYETKTIRKCETKQDISTQEVQIGYKNYFVYNGKEIYKITKHPRKVIHIQKTLSF